MTMCNAGFATTSLGLRACAGAVSPLAIPTNFGSSSTNVVARIFSNILITPCKRLTGRKSQSSTAPSFLGSKETIALSMAGSPLMSPR